MEVLDYGLSFIHGKAAANRVRFWLESRTRIIDERTGASEDYFQCGACKSEHTFAERDLFVADNYDFTPIFGPEWGVVFRRHCRITQTYREIRPADDWWGGLVYRLKQAAAVTEIKSNREIRAATHDTLPLVAQTEIWNDQTDLRAIIEYPVKTMNILDDCDSYQVDTGPVAFPDLAQRCERSAECISLAYVAFNVPEFADFVIEAPTKVQPDVCDSCETFHFSDIRSFAAVNRLYAVG